MLPTAKSSADLACRMSGRWAAGERAVKGPPNTIGPLGLPAANLWYRFRED